MDNFKDLEFVDISKINRHIILDVRYATSNNFTGRKVYTLPKCFLRRPVAEKLDGVQKSLEKIGLGLKIFDGYRPHSVQKIFWSFLPDERYIAHPEKGSRHNRGAAVDLTLVDKHGKELLMPTPFDDFSEKAHRDYHALPKEVIYNRCILENVMIAHGFTTFPTEWWHFDDKDWTRYPIEDISFEELGGL